MKTIEQLIDRFNNLLEVRSIQQSNVIQAGFDEDDLKSLIYHLGELKAIHDKSCDAISREAVLDAFSDYVGSGMSMNDFDALWDIVVKTQSVNPQEPKTIQEKGE